MPKMTTSQRLGHKVSVQHNRKMGALRRKVSLGGKPVLMEGLRYQAQTPEDWSGVATDQDTALRVGYEDIRSNWRGPMQVGPLSSFQVIEHDTHFEFASKLAA